MLGTLYGVAARFFSFPREDLLEDLDSGALVVRARAAAAGLGAPAVARAVEALAGAWSRSPASDPEDLVGQFEATYGVASAPPRPCALLYRALRADEASELGDLEAAQRAFGVRIAELLHERPDHVAVQTQFASYLARLEDGAEGMRAREALGTLLGEQLAGFAATLARHLRECAPPSVFVAAAELLAALTEEHCARLGIQPNERAYVSVSRPPAARPRPPERA
jgi:TorA maturation chaperone TorD